MELLVYCSALVGNTVMNQQASSTKDMAVTMEIQKSRQTTNVLPWAENRLHLGRGGGTTVYMYSTHGWKLKTTVI